LAVDVLDGGGPQRRRRVVIGAGGFVFGAAMMVAATGAATPRFLDASERGPVRVGLVQTNLPQDNRMAWSLRDRVSDLEDFLRLSRNVAADGPDFIVWPETMFPGSTLSPDAIDAEREAGLFHADLGLASTFFVDRLLDGQRDIGVPMIVGAIGVDGFEVVLLDSGGVDFDVDARFNSTFVVRDGAIAAERYDKMHLTPFGEVMPYISAWPWLERQLLAIGARGMAFDLDAGRDPVVHVLPTAAAGDVRVATPICFEVTADWVPRRLVTEGGERRADLMVHLTNDGWFGQFAGGRANHQLITRWRCIELATPAVRCANTGISSSIDARGRVLAEQPGWTDGTLTVEVMLPPEDALTIFARLGDVAGFTSLLATVVLGVLGVVRGRRTAKTAPKEQLDPTTD
ncbi:MAG: apolipoprotein N-acyltransferase, partial [Planctomycetota bacterium]